MRLIFLSFIICFFIGCENKDKKVYKKFDTAKTYQNKNQLLSDSKNDGGFEFESIAERDGWITNSSPNISGDPNAIKGDTLRFWADDVFPNTLRAFGKETRSQLNNLIESLIYEPLLSFDPETFKLEPALATHWKVKDDSLTFLFRLDPRARFSDGREVTADDVVATYNILIDEGHGDPNVYTFWSEKFNTPIAESKYIVSVKAKKTEWRNLYSLSAIYVYPSYYLKKIDGATYIDKYQFEMMPGSGPYILNNQRTTQENNGLVVLDRKRDYWAIQHPRNTGLYNFDGSQSTASNGVVATSNEFNFLWITDNDTLWDQINEVNINYQYPSNSYYPSANDPVLYDVCLILIDENSLLQCADTFCIEPKLFVDYFKGLYVPSALAPNANSGETSCFLPKGKSLTEYNLQIFDTWGNLVWQTSALTTLDGKPAIAWKGTTLDNKPLQQGTYVWKIYAKFSDGSVWPGIDEKTTGSIYLIR